MKTTKLFYALTIAAITCGCAKNTLGDQTPASVKAEEERVITASTTGDIIGKVVTGYQGWFSAKSDGSPLNIWAHQNYEMWPDVREYTKTYAGSPFSQNGGVTQPEFFGNLGNGQPAKVFSSYDQQVISTHFKWMQQNGIDCAALQRFGSYTTDNNLKAFHDGVDNMARIAAEATGRKFYIMYDCNTTANVEADWTNTIVNAQHLTSSSAYAKQNGKPVVCLWGVGFSGRGAAADWVTKINWFKQQGCYVIIGAPGNFSTDQVFQAAYTASNMIMPWYVGKRNNFQNSYTADLAYCKAHNLDYQGCAYAGFAFNNSNAAKPKNEIPRLHGDFMWSQFAGMRNAGVQNLYVAMFDEMNEGTAIFKVSENAAMQPAGNYFLSLDADGVHVSSDFYLRLVNNGGKMIKGLIPYQATHTTPFN